MRDLADLDPVAEAIYHLTVDNPVVDDALGGPEHVSGQMEAPWPHLAVFEGSLGDLTRKARVSHEITLELYGPQDHSIGKADLFRRMSRVLRSLEAMPEREPIPGRPVPLRCYIQGGVTMQPLTNGQLRFNATVVLHLGLPQS